MHVYLVSRSMYKKFAPMPAYSFFLTIQDRFFLLRFLNQHSVWNLGSIDREKQSDQNTGTMRSWLQLICMEFGGGARTRSRPACGSSQNLIIKGSCNLIPRIPRKQDIKRNKFVLNHTVDAEDNSQRLIRCRLLMIWK